MAKMKGKKIYMLIMVDQKKIYDCLNLNFIEILFVGL